MRSVDRCDGRQTAVTDEQGRVTFTGFVPITIRVEKPGYISVDRTLSSDTLVLMGNVWPTETEVAVRQTGLGEVISSGKLLLIWGDDRLIPALARETGNDSLGGWIDCFTLIVRHYSDRQRMVGIALHEIAQGWIGLRTHGTTCNPSDEAWLATVEGQAWVEAVERDFDPKTGPGPIVGFDDQRYGIPRRRGPPRTCPGGPQFSAWAESAFPLGLGKLWFYGSQQH